MADLQLNEEKFKEEIKAVLKKEFEKHYLMGLEAGFDAAVEAIYGQIKDLTNAKEIKKIIKEKTIRNKK